MNNEVHIKTYQEWLKYYENATKEQVIEDLTRDVQYFADAVKDIKDLQQELDKYKNIVDELEKDILDYFKKEYPNRKIEDYNLKNCTYDYALVILGKLKELRGFENE